MTKLANDRSSGKGNAKKLECKSEGITVNEVEST